MADWRKNTWSGSQDSISCQLPQHQPCLSISRTCISRCRFISSVETSARRMNTMLEMRSRRVRFLESSSLSRRRHVTFRSLVVPIANPRRNKCGTRSISQKSSKKARVNLVLPPCLVHKAHSLSPRLIQRCVTGASIATSDSDKQRSTS